MKALLFVSAVKRERAPKNEREGWRLQTPQHDKIWTPEQNKNSPLGVFKKMRTAARRRHCRIVWYARLARHRTIQWTRKLQYHYCFCQPTVSQSAVLYTGPPGVAVIDIFCVRRYNNVCDMFKLMHTTSVNGNVLSPTSTRACIRGNATYLTYQTLFPSALYVFPQHRKEDIKNMKAKVREIPGVYVSVGFFYICNINQGTN